MTFRNWWLVAGPTARTVTEWAGTCVRPASTTVWVAIPARSAACAVDSLFRRETIEHENSVQARRAVHVTTYRSDSVLALTAILVSPDNRQRRTRSGWSRTPALYAPRAACAHCASTPHMSVR